MPDARKIAFAGAALLVVAAAPAPLLPSHAIVLAVQWLLAVGWKAAYFVAAIGTHLLFYGTVGVLAALAFSGGPSPRERLLQLAVLPWLVTALVLIARALKLGHLPVLAN